MSPETFVHPLGAFSDTREVVERFYAAVRARDEAAVADLVQDWFAPDVVVKEPESLIYGGSYAGIDAARRVLGGIASPRSSLDGSKLEIEQIVEAVAESDKLDHVFVAISFALLPPGSDASIPMRAVQWWIFRDLQVASIESFYWDTAACAGLLRPVAATDDPTR